MKTRSRSAVVVLLVAFAALVLAVPAHATGVKSGTIQLTVPKAEVADLVGQHVNIVTGSPVKFMFMWNSGGVNWWYGLPIAGGSSYFYSQKRGTFYRSGNITFFDVVNNHQAQITSMKVEANGKSNYTLWGHVGGEAMNIATASNTPKISKNGKSVKIDGIQFHPTAGFKARIHALLTSVTLPDAMLFDADIPFKFK